ncbi:helix-turn-helix domain-containing protein [Streptomyces sp. ARC32]
MSGQEGPTLISSVQRAFRLMEAVGAHASGAPAKQLARETGLALGTTYHLLRTMVHDGYVRKLEDGTFVLGERLGALHAGSRDQTALSRVRPTLTELRDGLSAAAYLTLYEDGEIRVAEIVDGPKAPRVDLWVGFEDAGHATALGKSVLRELDADARADYLSRRAERPHPRTVTYRAELLRRLDASPPGTAVTDIEEYRLGTACVAVPVRRGDTIGSLGISVDVNRTTCLDDAVATLLDTAERVSRGLSLTI